MPQVDAASIALFQDTLQTLFGLLTSTMIPAKPNPAHDAIVKFIKHHPATTIVTTNYDGCIDEALLKAGVETTTGINEEEGSPRGTELIKMHGSINWSYCDSCQDVREFSLLEMKRAYEEDTLSYAVIGICKTCGGQRRPLLVPPLSFKFLMFPNLVGLWNQARHRLEESDWLFVVGYSFSEADTYIPKMIARSLTVNQGQKMIVCDTDPKLVSSLREKYAAHIDGFDVKRVLLARGSCEEVLPEILAKVIDKSERSKAKNESHKRGK